MFVELSIAIPNANTTLAFAVGAASAQSPVVFPATENGPGQCVIYSTVECWVRRGVNPTVLLDGTDMRIPAGVLLRTTLSPGERIAAAAVTGTGVFTITPSV